jgi:hypothetical protein
MSGGQVQTDKTHQRRMGKGCILVGLITFIRSSPSLTASGR